MDTKKQNSDPVVTKPTDSKSTSFTVSVSRGRRFDEILSWTPSSCVSRPTGPAPKWLRDLGVSQVTLAVGDALRCRPAAELEDMTPSMSRTANCQDKAIMESFWSSLKAEAFHCFLAACSKVRLMSHGCINALHKAHRLHSSFTFQSPTAFERFVIQNLN